MERSNVDVMRSDTQLEVTRRKLAGEPERADLVRARGRDSFYDAFWGRYGLPGNTLSQPVSAIDGVKDGFDLTNMSAADVIALAQDLVNSGKLEGQEGALLGFDFDRLSFAGDMAFLSSPLALLQGGLSQGTATSRTYNWLNEYQSQLLHLQENNASSAAIDGTRNVLDQLNLLQTEQNMYWAMGLYSDGSKRDSTGFLSGGLVAPTNLVALLGEQ